MLKKIYPHLCGGATLLRLVSNRIKYMWINIYIIYIMLINIYPPICVGEATLMRLLSLTQRCDWGGAGRAARDRFPVSLRILHT